MALSFSSWLTDYLFESLPKSRKFPPVTYGYAFVLTFLLGGLWHGLTVNFLIWGALHGFGLWCFYLLTLWRRSRGGAARKEGSVLGRIGGALLTFHFVCFTWIFFRAQDLPTAKLELQQIASRTAGVENVTRLVCRVCTGVRPAAGLGAGCGAGRGRAGDSGAGGAWLGGVRIRQLLMRA